MSLVINLPDMLVDQLRLRAEAEHVSIEELAQRILQHGLERPLTAIHWNTVNQRRLQLIEKRFAGGLSSEEEWQLRQLQEVADQQLEKLDEEVARDLTQMEQLAADALKD